MDTHIKNQFKNWLTGKYDIVLNIVRYLWICKLLPKKAIYPDLPWPWFKIFSCVLTLLDDALNPDPIIGFDVLKSWVLTNPTIKAAP